jgi:RNA polymerase sigma factor (sigma-70 family)
VTGGGSTQRAREAALADSALEWFAAASWLVAQIPRFGAQLRGLQGRPPAKERKRWLRKLRSILARAAKSRASQAFRHAAAEMVKRGDRLLWDLVSAWSDLAWRKVNQVTHKSMVQADVHQHVMVGMHDAAVCWDPSKSRFSSWAGWHIRMAINDPGPRSDVVHIAGQDRWRARRAAQAMERDGATLSEAAADLGATVHKLQALHRATRPAVRQDGGRGEASTYGVSGSTTGLNAAPWDQEAKPHEADQMEEDLDRARLGRLVHAEIEHLPAAAVPVICWFYGITHKRHNPTGERLTYAQIAKRKGCTASWIQAILTRTRRLLRTQLAFRVGTLQAVSWYVAEEHPARVAAWARATTAALANGEVEPHHVELAVKALFRLGHAVPLPPGGHASGYCSARPSATTTQSQPMTGSSTTAATPQTTSIVCTSMGG